VTSTVSTVAADELKLVQVYETTVASTESNYVFRFLTVPRQFVRVQGDSAVVANLLGLQHVQQIEATSLPQAIMAMLAADSATSPSDLQVQALIAQFLQPPEVPAQSRRFAEELAFATIVPFAESPLAAVSLASKVAGFAKSPIALGSFVGALAGSAPLAVGGVVAFPLLIITVPAGIILCGTAAAFAKFVDERRDDVFSKLVGITARTAAGQTGAAAGSTVTPVAG
jgi:hypothetical protein